MEQFGNCKACSEVDPIVVASLGIYIHRVTKRFEHSQWRNQKVIEKRLAIYDSLAPQLNELLCYFIYVGTWKELDPLKVIQMKREVDRKIYLAQPLFSEQFFGACMDFMNLCFATYQGWGLDAQLRTSFERRRQAHTAWKQDWESCFSDKSSDPQKIMESYRNIMRVFTSEIGLEDGPKKIFTGRVPDNIE
jgi:hypothetical protein